MSSTSETGHAKNTANFEDLIAFCTGYGATYNPSKSTLKIPALTAQLTAAKATIAAVTTSNITYNNAVNTRIIAFQDLRKLSTRLINALSATNATPQLIKDAKTINTKIQGARASKTSKLAQAIAPVILSGAVVPTSEAPKTISVSQQSYDNLIEHFSKITALLATEPSYTPNETDLKIATLTTLQNTLKTSNTTVINTYTAVSNARIARNTALYTAPTALTTTAKEIKQYIKSIYGATSPQYKQISALQFRAVKN